MSESKSLSELRNFYVELLKAKDAEIAGLKLQLEQAAKALGGEIELEWPEPTRTSHPAKLGETRIRPAFPIENDEIG